MRRLLVFLALIILACRAFTPPEPAFRIPTYEVQAEESATSTITPAPSLLHEATDTPTPAPGQPSGKLLELDDLDATSFRVILHPDGELYVGDLISFEVIAPSGLKMEERSVEIQVNPPQGEKLRAEKFGNYGIANRQQATLIWAWDTHGLHAGAHVLSFTILPEGISWTETVVLRPENEIPLAERKAQWTTAESACCVFHYLTGTAAERDLPALLEQADIQAQRASEHFGIDFSDPITITLIPRVLGHGGFAGNEISISYLDRNYAGSQFSQVLHHEMVHILDSRLGGELRPTLLVEGLAVYLSGGHFKPEPLMPRAAALLALPSPSPDVNLGWYLPLQQLTDNFYPSQHEIGYLQAGALVEYMVETWGWQEFTKFYRDIHPHESQSQARAIDQALQKHFGISFSELERDFLDTLKNQEVTPQLMEDVRLTVLFYDTVRRYQQLLDPSAYFQTAWLLDNGQMRQRGIVADYLRHPSASLNVALERLLIAADVHLRQGKYPEAAKILSAVNNLLDTVGGEPVKVENRQGSFWFLASRVLENQEMRWKQPLWDAVTAASIR